MNDTLERFFSKVEVTDSCWLWVGGSNKWGYGKFYVDSRTLRAHRVSYAWFYGDLPDYPELELDHTCRIRLCVNPEHLEPVTCGVNIRRGETGLYQKVRTHCPQDHEYSVDNTTIYKGGRQCKECHRTQERERYRRMKGVQV